MTEPPGRQAPSLNRQILRLAVLVGHLPEVAYLGAVAVASVIFDVLYWGFGFLRMGTTALVAQYWGAGRRDACAEALYQSCLIGLAAGVVFVLLQSLIADIGFDLVGGSPDVKLWGRRYFTIRIYGAPFVLVGFVLTGFFRGVADAVSPMWMTLVANVANVVGDYGLIFGRMGFPKLGVEGAAWASVLASSCSLLYGLVVLAKRHRRHLPAILLFVHVLGLGLQGAWMGYNGLMAGRFLALQGQTLGAHVRGRAERRRTVT